MRGVRQIIRQQTVFYRLKNTPCLLLRQNASLKMKKAVLRSFAAQNGFLHPAAEESFVLRQKRVDKFIKTM